MNLWWIITVPPLDFKAMLEWLFFQSFFYEYTQVYESFILFNKAIFQPLYDRHMNLKTTIFLLFWGEN